MQGVIKKMLLTDYTFNKWWGRPISRKCPANIVLVSTQQNPRKQLIFQHDSLRAAMEYKNIIQYTKKTYKPYTKKKT